MSWEVRGDLDRESDSNQASPSIILTLKTRPIRIPIGPVTLPTICVNNPSNPITQMRSNGMKGNLVVCRDTIDQVCSDCGYFDQHCLLR
ncbi:MAG: hypothetical protein IPP15_12170 [Saprospiraceae bacterium]|uniref:Uncharacterized protein n=1 Tax=Candidatus Opimibacter skivensis TaxID=2982028 RepID=A0A9D7SWE9_9BACT|nr:hypothetical protein [Candidatus Opimibacter skivensis]